MAAFKIRQTVDLNSSGPQEIKQAHGHVGDKKAHEWEVSVVRGGAPVDLTGYAAMALVNNGVGTVNIVATITGNVASAVFPAACYTEGTHECFMRISNAGDSSEAITAIMHLSVTAGETDTPVDPGADITTTLSGLLASEAARVAAEEERAAFYDGFSSRLAEITKLRNPSGAALANTLLAGRKSVVLNVLSDSTGNENTEWVYLLGQYIKDNYPAYNVKYKLYDYANARYGAWSHIGTPGTERGISVSVGGKVPPIMDCADVPVTSGDIDIEFEVAMPNWASGTERYLLTRYGASGSRCWIITVSTDNKFKFLFSTDGTSVSTATIHGWTTDVLTNDTFYRFRIKFDADDGAGHYTLKLYQSTDGGITWNQLGSTYTGTSAVTLFTSATQPYALGGASNTASAVCTFHEVKIRDGLDGLIVNPQPIEMFIPSATDAFNGRSVIGAPTVYLYNASIPGWGIATNDTIYGSTVVPCKNGHLFISEGHNDTMYVGTQYVAKLTALLTSIRARNKQPHVYVMTQNPCITPTTELDLRDARRDDQMGFAANNGLALIDIYTRMLLDSRGMAALLNVDGLHPNADGEQVILNGVIDYTGI